MKRAFAFLLALVMAFSLVACGGDKDTTTTPDAGKDTTSTTPDTSKDTTSEQKFDGTVVIGVNDCLTGGSAVYGIPEVNAMDIAVMQINEAGGVKIGDKAYKMELLKYDNKSDPNEAVSVVRKLIDRDGVKFITGWAGSGATMAAAQMIGEEDALMMVATAGELSITAQGHDNVFRVRVPGAYTGGPAGEFVYRDGNKSVAIVGQLKDALRAQYSEHFVTQFEASGGKVVAQESFEASDRDMYTQLTKALAGKPDALFVPGDVEGVAFVVKQARELGFEGRIYLYSGGSRDQFLEVLSMEELEGLCDIRPVEGTVEALGETAKIYNDLYIEMFGEEPAPCGIYGYDAIWALKAGMEVAGSIDDVDAVVKALHEMPIADGVAQEYLTVDGKMFDENGQAYTTNMVLQWQNGELNIYEKLVSDPVSFSEYLSGVTAQNVASR